MQINTLPEVDLGDDLSVEQGEIITLFAGYDFVEYLWNTKDTSAYLDIYTVDMIPQEYTFDIIVTDTNQCENMDSLKVEVIGNEEEVIKVIAYPNPTKNYLLLRISNLEPNTQIQVQLITAKGDMIWNDDFNIKSKTFEHNFNLQQLSPGTYNLKVTYGIGSSIIKVIKM